MPQPQFDKLDFRRAYRGADAPGKAALILATWFGAGLFPVAQGTAGTVAAVPLVLITAHAGMVARGLILFILTAAAVFVSGRAQDLIGTPDPPAVVIDEAAGFVTAVFFLPPGGTYLLLGFVLFRFFDILKPWPIKRVERLGGGFGIVMDDLLAGLYASAVAAVIVFLWDLFPGA